jgi:hypothetical protein
MLKKVLMFGYKAFNVCDELQRAASIWLVKASWLLKSVFSTKTCSTIELTP